MTDFANQPIGMDADGNEITRCPPDYDDPHVYSYSNPCGPPLVAEWYEQPAPHNFALPERRTDWLPARLRRALGLRGKS